MNKSMKNSSKSNHSMMYLITGAALGGAMMYLFDPVQGRRRRALLRDQGYHLLSEIQYWGGKSYRDLRNRSRGIVAKSTAFSSVKFVNDTTLKARVRSEIGRKISHSHAVDVQVNQGEVTLSGPILANEVDEVLRCAEGVPGVRSVINNLEIHTAQDIPALQGKGKPYLHP